MKTITEYIAEVEAKLKREDLSDPLRKTLEGSKSELEQIVERGCRYTNEDCDAKGRALSALQGAIDPRFDPDMEWRNGCYQRKTA